MAAWDGPAAITTGEALARPSAVEALATPIAIAALATPSSVAALASPSAVVSALENSDVLAMLADLDLHVAALKNELRTVHEAAAAQTARLRAVKSLLTRRRTLVQDSATSAGRLRAAARAAARAAEVAAVRAEESATSSAMVLGAHAQARKAYADLHLHARRVISRLAAELAASRDAQHGLQAQLIETGMLLLQTHSALGTRIDKAVKLRRVRESMEALAAQSIEARLGEGVFDILSLGLTEPLELLPDISAEASIEAGRAAVAVAAAARDARTAAVLSGPDGEHDGPQSEASFLQEVDESVEHGHVTRDRASLQAYDVLVRSGTSLLLQPPVNERWYTSSRERGRRLHAWEQAKAGRAASERAEAVSSAREEFRVQKMLQLTSELQQSSARYEERIRELSEELQESRARHRESRQKHEACERDAAEAARSAQAAELQIVSLRAAADSAEAVAAAREDTRADRIRRLEAEVAKTKDRCDEWERVAAVREDATASRDEVLRQSEAKYAKLRVEWSSEFLHATESIATQLAALTQGLESQREGAQSHAVGATVQDAAIRQLEGENAWMKERLAELTSAVANLCVAASAVTPRQPSQLAAAFAIGLSTDTAAEGAHATAPASSLAAAVATDAAGRARAALAGADTRAAPAPSAAANLAVLRPANTATPGTASARMLRVSVDAPPRSQSDPTRRSSSASASPSAHGATESTDACQNPSPSQSPSRRSSAGLCWRRGSGGSEPSGSPRFTGIPSPRGPSPSAMRISPSAARIPFPITKAWPAAEEPAAGQVLAGPSQLRADEESNTVSLVMPQLWLDRPPTLTAALIVQEADRRLQAEGGAERVVLPSTERVGPYSPGADQERHATPMAAPATEPIRDDDYYMARARELRKIREESQQRSASAHATEAGNVRGGDGNVDRTEHALLDVHSRSSSVSSLSSIEVDW